MEQYLPGCAIVAKRSLQTMLYGTIHHNEIRDMTASLLTEVCGDCLQPLSGETFLCQYYSDGARLDVQARGFWVVGQDTFLDVRVFHPHAPTNRFVKSI
jgi:hypothetical protein